MKWLGIVGLSLLPAVLLFILPWLARGSIGYASIQISLFLSVSFGFTGVIAILDVMGTNRSRSEVALWATATIIAVVPAIWFAGALILSR